MKIHYGYIYNAGDYETKIMCCEQTACGIDTEKTIENVTEDWDCVSCKKCLKLKDAVIQGKKRDEEIIIKQMGDFAEWMERQEKQNK